MNNRFLLLLFFSFVSSASSVSYAQIQVSEIEYFLQGDEYPRKGFMKVDSDEYYIAQGIEGTRVYRVDGVQLEFIHELNYRPTNSSLNTHTHSYAQSNSGFIYEGELLYELYWDYIYVVNIISGELHDIIDLTMEGIRLQTDFILGESFIYFTALDCEQSCKIRYDKLSKNFVEIDEADIIIGSNLYYKESQSAISHLDLNENFKTELPQTFSNISKLSELYIADKATLLVKDDNGLTLIQNGELIDVINCNIPDTLSILSIYENKIACINKIEESSDEIVIYDAELCKPTHIIPLTNDESTAFINYNFKELGDKYILCGYYNNWQGLGSCYLMDLNTLTLKHLDLPMDYLYEDQLIKYRDKIYIISKDFTHYSGNKAALYEIDLSTLNASKVSNIPVEDIYNIVIGEYQNDRSIHAYYQTKDQSTLFKIETIDPNLEEIQTFDYTKNFGIYWHISTDIWSHGKYFFSTSDAIFVMDNGITNKLLDISPNTGTSSYKSLGDFIYVLSKLDDAHYVIKINAIDLTYSVQAVPNLDHIYYKKINTDNAIVNLSQGSLPGYYDLEEETYIAFKEIGLDSYAEAVSGNNILFERSGSDGGEWLIHNTVSKQTILTDITPNTHPDPIPDGNGGFYFEPWQFSEDTSLFYIDELGNYTELIADFNNFLFYGGNRMDGEIKSLAFDGEENMIIFSTNGIQNAVKTIPDGGIQYYQDRSYFWHESDNRSILEIYNGASYDTYTFTFDSEPIKILESREDRLVLVIEEEDREILIFKDENDLITFYEYGNSTQELINVQSLQSVKNIGFGNDIFKLDNSKYLMLLNNGIHGLEPWLYNSKNHNLRMINDLNNSFTSSFPKDFTVGPDETLYFSTLLETKDRQLVKLDEQLTSTNEIVSKDLEKLIVFPSPSNGIIQLLSDQNQVQILNLQGMVLHQLSNYKKGESIPLSHLENNVYLVKALSPKGEIKYAKFILVSE